MFICSENVMKNKLLVIFFIVQYLFIAAVGSYDAYLIIKFRDYIYDLEENPFGRWLMEIDGRDVSLFIGVKMFGTIIALGLLAYIYSKNRLEAHITTIALTLFQIGLLLYLHGFIK